MSQVYTQEKHQLSIETPLGPDVLLLTQFSGREEMSQLFHYDLDTSLFTQMTFLQGLRCRADASARAATLSAPV